SHYPPDKEDEDFEEDPRPLVNVIAPKIDPKVAREVTVQAQVQPFYRAELPARVTGQIKYIHKNIGDRIVKGELLVEIDVPDLVQAVAEKEALIHLATQDRAAAVARVQT